MDSQASNREPPAAGDPEVPATASPGGVRMERPRNPAPEKTLRESKSALLEAAQAAVAEQRAKQSLPAGYLPPPGSTGRQVFRGLLAMVALAGSFLILSQPTWLAGPKLPAESSAVQAASATLALVEAVSHIRAFREVRGRLPRALAEAGVRTSAIRYEPQGQDRFIVRLQAGDSLIVVRSTDSLKPLVVKAILTLQRRT